MRVSVTSAPFKRTAFRLQPGGVEIVILFLPGVPLAANVQSSCTGAGADPPNDTNIGPVGIVITFTRNADGVSDTAVGGSRMTRPEAVIGASATSLTSAMSSP